MSKLPSHSKWEIGKEEIIDLRPHGPPVRDWETAGGWKLCWSQDKKAASPPPSFNITKARYDPNQYNQHNQGPNAHLLVFLFRCIFKVGWLLRPGSLCHLIRALYWAEDYIVPVIKLWQCQFVTQKGGNDSLNYVSPAVFWTCLGGNSSCFSETFCLLEVGSGENFCMHELEELEEKEEEE